MTIIHPPPEAPSSTPSSSRHIVASPYNDADHLLDLRTLDKENQLLARALTKLTNTRDDYATAPYRESFSWGEVLAELKGLAKDQNHDWRETFFYVIAFRSRIPPTTVYADLETLDKAAHREAVESGGLLKYWFSLPDANGRNLATCVWRSQEDAKKGGTGPAHRKASGATRALYTEWRIERYRLVIRDRIQSWDIIDWID